MSILRFTHRMNNNENSTVTQHKDEGIFSNTSVSANFLWLLTLLYSEWPKHYVVFAVLSAVELIQLKKASKGRKFQKRE